MKLVKTIKIINKCLFSLAFILTFIISLSVIGCNNTETISNQQVDNSLSNGEISPVKIVIYSDFQCGACSRFNSETEPQLREYENAGIAETEIRLLGALGEDSIRAAQAALWAAEYGKFLEYQDALFLRWRQEEDGLYSKDKLIEIAATLGMDTESLIVCLENQNYRIQLEENLNLARSDGVDTLPAIIINGLKIQGYKSLEIYTQAIDQAMMRN